MSVNWVRAYNRLFEIINSQGEVYYSGGRFISKIREVDPYFHNYSQYIELRNRLGKSTSRKDYFYDILLDLEENQRLQVIKSILDEVREVFPEKVLALEKELNISNSTENTYSVTLQSNAGQLESSTYIHHKTESLSNTAEVPSHVQIESSALPKEFDRGMEFKIRDSIAVVKKFWIIHWQWIIGTVLAIAALILS